MRAHLTEITIRNLRPPEQGQAVYWDQNLRAFGCRVSQGGAKAWVVKQSGKLTTLGRWPALSLAIARTEAKRILYQGSTSLLEEDVAFEDALTAFIEEKEQRKRPATAKGYNRLLSRHFAFGRLPVSEITRREIVNRLDKLKETPSEEAHALAALKVFFGWSMRRGYAELNPAASLQASVRLIPRSRVLSDKELRRVLYAAVGTPHPFGPIIQLLIQTGQRRTEIGQLQWEWIDQKEKLITLPAAVCKNNREHTFPFGPLTAKLLNTLPRTGPYLFPASRDHVRGKPTTAFNGWSKSTARFRSACGVDFRLHDLRRVFSSGMAALGVSQVVVEKLLNHITGGTQSPIAQTYNVYRYLDEQRAATALWHDRLAKILKQD